MRYECIDWTECFLSSVILRVLFISKLMAILYQNTCCYILVYKYLMLKLKIQGLPNWWKVSFLNYKWNQSRLLLFIIIFLPIFSYISTNTCKTMCILFYTRLKKRTPCLFNMLFTVGINFWGEKWNGKTI